MRSEILSWEDLSPAEKAVIKIRSEQSLSYFIRIWFQLIQGQHFLFNWHHAMEIAVAERVAAGELTRVIVNVAPGSTKTEIWSIHLPAWGIVQCRVKKRSSRWLPLSYSDTLVVENSARVKEIVSSDPFQELWPMELSRDIKAKYNWEFKDENGNKHKMFGCSLGGAATGRRAGFMTPGFTGAMIIDDPMPPMDAFSSTTIQKSNESLNRVARSRLAMDSTPAILIQQRIIKGDSTDFLMSDKSPDEFELFKIPALIDREYIDSLPPDIREQCIKDTGFTGDPVSYWPTKEPTETLLDIKRADPELFASQYQQAPDIRLSEGVVYRKQVELVVDEGRFCEIPIEPSLPAYTFWDLGLGDYMVFWIVQPHKLELRLVDCYANSGEDMPHYVNWLGEWSRKHGVSFKQHVAPHDIAVRDIMTKRSRMSVAREMGLNFKKVPRCKSKSDSINALKKLFPRIWISKRCAQVNPTGHSGWEALKTLQREWDYDNEVFRDGLTPKLATNYTDALQQMGLHWRDEQKPDVGHFGKQQYAGTNGWMAS